MERIDILREAHWILSCRFTSEMHRLEKEHPEMLVKNLRSVDQLAGRILRAIKLMEELYPELDRE